MNNNTNTVWIVLGGVGIGLLISFLFFPNTRFGGMMSWGRNGIDSSDVRAPRGSTAAFIDQHFIEQMIPHHDGAIAMATLALTKATHPEIKTLAGAIIEAQTKEIGDMRGWYSDWFGKNVPTSGSTMMGGMMSGSGMHMGGQEDMAALESASDFDKAFIEQMIPHHQLAIMMAQMLRSGTDRPEMLELAENIIESQSDEIEQMQDWYQVWYR